MQPSEWGEHGQFKDLMASQQRQLGRLIEKQLALEEDDFDLTVTDGEWAGFLSYVEVPVIVYEPEQFFFSLTYFPATHDGLGHVPAGHAIYFKPGERSPDERYMQVDWKDVRRYFGNWLGYIARELDLADDPELEDDDVEENDEDDEPEQGDEWDEEYEDDAEEAPAPSVVTSAEPDQPVEEDLDEPEPIPATPLTAASTPTPDAPPRELPPPSWFQRASDWARVQKEKHGVLWGMIAFVVVLIVTIIAALL